MKENEVGVILEEVRDQYQAIQEGIDSLLPMREDVSGLKADMSEIRADINVIKGVIRVHSADVAELKAKVA